MSLSWDLGKANKIIIFRMWSTAQLYDSIRSMLELLQLLLILAISNMVKCILVLNDSERSL